MMTTTGRPPREALERERELLRQQRGREALDHPGSDALRLVTARLGEIETQLEDLAMAAVEGGHHVAVDRGARGPPRCKDRGDDDADGESDGYRRVPLDAGGPPAL